MKKAVLTIASLVPLLSVFAQHPHHHPQPARRDTAVADSGHVHGGEAMSSALSLSLPMSRNGSGTSWQPDNSPIYAYMFHKGRTMVMVHGNVFVRYNAQNFNHRGARGYAREVDVPNFGMVMAQRQMGRNGLLSVHGMFSLDWLAMGEEGYPLVYQTGETYGNGIPLVDRQHPHDLFAELSVGYAHRLSPDVDVYGYLAYPGEPALGPTAFMHRASTINNANAPLSHHWQDATHITFGVGTVGVRYKIAKLEGSVFTGREPDETRWDFDPPRFDSYALRLSVNPTRSLAIQVSQGFLRSPEWTHPQDDVMKTTAAVAHTVNMSRNAFVASTAVYGLNNSHEELAHSVLLESNMQVRRVAVYGRYEFVQKSWEEMVLPQFEGIRFNLHAWTLGSNLRLITWARTDLLVGAQGTLSKTFDILDPIYGRWPASAQVYLQVRPTRLHVGRID